MELFWQKKNSKKWKKKYLLKPDIVALIPTFGGRRGGYLWDWGQPVWHSETLSWKAISSVFLSFIYSFMDFIQVEYLYLKFLGPEYVRFQIFKNISGIYFISPYIYIYGGLFWGWDSSWIMRLVVSRCLIHISWGYVHNIF